MENLQKIYATKRDTVLETRHEIHRRPELSNQEFATTALLRRRLTEAGIEILDLPLRTGLVAIIRGAKPGKTVALRGDIDALPITEAEDHTLRSENEGVMHACGHDVHTTGLLGAALILNELRSELCGSVLLIFQPAEEVSTGALDVINTGVFDRIPVSAFYALHVDPTYPEGKISLHEGSDMAACAKFAVSIHGKGSHGATPHFSHDPIAAGLTVVHDLQNISGRRVDPLEPFALSVCYVHAGTAFNIIPNDMEILGTFRFATEALRADLKRWITEIAEHGAAAGECTAEVVFSCELPPVVNDRALLRKAAEAAEQLRPGSVEYGPMKLVSEDFALYDRYAPTMLGHVGCGRPDADNALHNCNLNVSDSVVEHSALLLAGFALRELAE